MRCATWAWAWTQHGHGHERVGSQIDERSVPIDGTCAPAHRRVALLSLPGILSPPKATSERTGSLYLRSSARTFARALMRPSQCAGERRYCHVESCANTRSLVVFRSVLAWLAVSCICTGTDRGAVLSVSSVVNAHVSMPARDTGGVTRRRGSTNGGCEGPLAPCIRSVYSRWTARSTHDSCARTAVPQHGRSSVQLYSCTSSCLPLTLSESSDHRRHSWSFRDSECRRQRRESRVRPDRARVRPSPASERHALTPSALSRTRASRHVLQ